MVIRSFITKYGNIRIVMANSFPAGDLESELSVKISGVSFESAKKSQLLG